MSAWSQIADSARRAAKEPLGLWQCKRLRDMALWLLFVLLLLWAVLHYGELVLAATPAPKQAVQAKKKALHGKAWAFGQSEDRKAAIWRRGVPTQSLTQRALNGASAQAAKAAGAEKPATGKALVSKAAKGKAVVNTGGGINRALATATPSAQAQALPQAARSARAKGSLGLSMQDSTTTWNVTPMRESMRPDEVMARDKRHVLRAFAGVAPGDDMSISVGPELILKDEQHCAESAGTSQPDSALGLGMQFKMDF